MRTKQFFFVTTMLISGLLNAQESATFKCTITNPLRDFVVIEKLVKPVAKRDTLKLDDKNSFTFSTDDLEEPQAYRVVYGDRKSQTNPMDANNNGQMVIMAIMVDKFEMMLQNGFNLVIAFDAKNKDKTLKITGKGYELSSYYQEKDVLDGAFILQYPAIVRSPKDTLLKALDTYYKKKLGLINKHLPPLKYIDKQYINNEKKTLTYNIAQRKVNYATTQINRYKNDSIVNVFNEKYFAFLKDIPFDKTENKDFFPYTVFVRTYVNYLLAKNSKGGKISDADKFTQKYEIYKTLFKSDILRDFQMYDLLDQNNSKAREPWYEAAAKDYNTRAKSDSLKQELLNVLEIRRHMGKGEPAFNFSLYDRDGKKHSLSDYKGQYVVLDTWATWCKPCVHEIPYLQKLETDFVGKPIVFISISVDDDSTRWRKFMDRKEMHGHQLWSGRDNYKGGFYKEYLIQGIPRFIVIDREGKFIDPQAPRPSTPDLFNMLRGLDGLKFTAPPQQPATADSNSPN